MKVHLNTRVRRKRRTQGVRALFIPRMGSRHVRSPKQGSCSFTFPRSLILLFRKWPALCLLKLRDLPNLPPHAKRPFAYSHRLKLLCGIFSLT
ncbi:hypothetical protein AVEN_255859-1 [Araneus ventricosus]|uniref:Uncharacterized protein n=1 Tax=Araneus ventricosus TaxID=182803 RepID=A0A4Y2EJU5_ARAVE|nr:hypothetical protein AVEN_255859-1 [Araneus ventricosus]